MTEIKNTGWKRIDDTIRLAQKYGLAVEVDNRTEDGLCSISLEIRQIVNPERDDVLAMNQRSESIRLHWCWIPGNGRTPRLAGARFWSLGRETEDLTKDARKHHLPVRQVIAIQMRAMADTQERHP